MRLPRLHASTTRWATPQPSRAAPRSGPPTTGSPSVRPEDTTSHRLLGVTQRPPVAAGTDVNLCDRAANGRQCRLGGHPRRPSPAPIGFSTMSAVGPTTREDLEAHLSTPVREGIYELFGVGSSATSTRSSTWRPGRHHRLTPIEPSTRGSHTQNKSLRHRPADWKCNEVPWVGIPLCRRYCFRITTKRQLEQTH